MTDSLRDKIAAVIRSALLEVDYSDAEKSADGDQWVFIDGTVIPENLADAVIRQLADECRAGCMWQIPNHIEDMTEAQRERLGLNHYCRYCGGFGPEQSQ